MLKIVLERIRDKTESEINDEQAGFRRGKRNQITNLRILMQKLKEHQQPLYMCFVDFTKAFDNISHEQLWVTMTEMGYPVHIIILLTKLYGKQQARVRVEWGPGGLSNEFGVKKRVRQRCVISPYLFNIMAEVVMREVMDGWEGGVHIGGRRLTDLRYADDIVLLAESEEELQKIVNRLYQVGSEKGLLINIDKTKIMTLNGKMRNIILNGSRLEQVSTFQYLGSMIAEDAECSKEIREKLARGQSAETGMKQIWKSHGIKLTTKVRLMKALVWPVATYGCESWTIKKRDE